MSQSALARGFKVSPKTVQQWDREGLADAARLGMKGRTIEYDVWKAVEWKNRRDVARVVRDSSPDEMDAARLRKLEAEAEMKELDVGERRGELVPLDEVAGMLREAMETIDSVLRHAPARFSPALAKAASIPTKGARVILEDVIEAVRGSVREGPDA